MLHHYLKSQAPSILHGGWTGLRCAGHRFVTAFLIATLLTGACSQASTQFSDLLAKAKAKAKEQAEKAKKSINDKIDKTIGSDPSALSNKVASPPSQSPATPSSPDATKEPREAATEVPATGTPEALPATDEKNKAPEKEPGSASTTQAQDTEAAFGFCSSFVPNIARFYSGVFRVEHAGPMVSTTPKGKLIAQRFGEYIVETYNADPKRLSSPNCFYGGKTQAQDRLATLQARHQASASKVIFSGWEWDGKDTSASPAQ